VAVAGELDLSVVPRLAEPLTEQIDQRPGVMVDLTRLTFIDSSGIGALIKASRDANGALLAVLIVPGSQVDRVFDIAGIAETLPVFTDRDEALAALAGQDRDGALAT